MNLIAGSAPSKRQMVGPSTLVGRALRGCIPRCWRARAVDGRNRGMTATLRRARERAVIASAARSLGSTEHRSSRCERFCGRDIHLAGDFRFQRHGHLRRHDPVANAALRGPWLDEVLDPTSFGQRRRTHQPDPRRLVQRYASTELQCLGDGAQLARRDVDRRRPDCLEPAGRRADGSCRTSVRAAAARPGRFQLGAAAAHPVLAAGDGSLRHLPFSLLANGGAAGTDLCASFNMPKSEPPKGLKAPYPKASRRFTLPKSPIRFPEEAQF